MEPLEGGKFIYAWLTPGCPEIDQDNRALEIGDVYGVSINISKLKVRNSIPNRTDS